MSIMNEFGAAKKKYYVCAAATAAALQTSKIGAQLISCKASEAMLFVLFIESNRC